MEGAELIIDLRSKLNNDQLDWLDTSEDEVAVEARWLESLIDAGCKEHITELEEMLKRVINTCDYYLEYTIEGGDNTQVNSMWNLLNKVVGKKIYTNAIGNHSFELIGTLPAHNAVLVRSERLEGFLLLDSGISICWEREEQI